MGCLSSACTYVAVSKDMYIRMYCKSPIGCVSMYVQTYKCVLTYIYSMYVQYTFMYVHIQYVCTVYIYVCT